MQANGDLDNYIRVMDRVCDYIYANLDEELTVDHLSDFAGFSKYHFHRQFSDYLGIGIAKYIQLLRLKRASYRLYFDHEAKIIDIALDAKFDYPESFARAFKKAFDQSPTEFRRQPKWLEWNEKYHFGVKKMGKDQKVELVNFAETKIAVFEHRGAPELVNESAAKFIAWRKQTGLSPVSKSQTFGMIYEDPKSVPAKDFRFDICGSVLHEVPDNSLGVLNKVIPQGRCAVIRHHGSHDNLDAKVHYLYGQWLPQSGESLRDFPCFFHYHNFFPEVAEHELITDIYLPLN
ncbi:AraC family transcriptional regulator [Shewanella nanhaiensis]|uniref:AraC family transcriptional regulator n=1 Tax=Shewanella nanhaiensis TaxID=2864872 RepID=A0ABS7DZZ8_9GAMM|nr:AraC family transcriptional regulator [Shewanella nanhaiensis]MBW8182506.1 AraC family transcriptional regulator [Shewanella nanhaiensis]